MMRLLPLLALWLGAASVVMSVGVDLNQHGLTGSWYDPATSGQGITVDVDPGSRALFLAWYTCAPNGSGAVPAGQYMKRDRLRLRRPSGAHDAFLLAATAQNLRRMAKWLTPVAQEAEQIMA